MKKIYLSSVCVMCLILNSASQTFVNWSAPLSVVSASGYSNIYPRLTLMSGDLPLVTWESASADKIYRAKWTGSSFTLPVAVNPPGVIPFVANWAGAEVASSGDTAHIVFFSEPVMEAEIYIVSSYDGGITFGDTVRVDTPGTSNIPAFPSVAVFPGGNPVVNYMLTDSAMMDAEYLIARSQNGGSSFLPPVIPSLGAPGFVCDCCPASTVIKDNNVALLYRNDDTNIRDIWASFSNDGAATFPVSTEIDQTNWYITACPSSGPSGIIIGDSLFYTWMSDASTDARIYAGSVNINDQEVGSNRQLYPIGTSTQNFPVIAGKGDTLGVVWQGYSGSFQEVLFTYSVTGMSGLGVKVDTLTKAFTGHQSRPDIVFNNGKFHIIYSDSNGSSVKYLSGNVSIATGINESEISGASLSSFYNGESLILNVNSENDRKATCSVYNSVGQSVYTSDIHIAKGKTSKVITENFRSGIYFVSIQDNSGKVLTTKVRITK
ncbi:MAG: hypothetical protein K0S44_797 [Bacteroidetes bacterium]|nr:hypothetical protein [Bacteroidota bacterium]